MAVGVCLLPSNVHSQFEQPYIHFEVDLQKVVQIYDELNMYQEAVWDTMPPFDYTTFNLGLRNKIPHFLKSHFQRYKRDVDYLGVEGYRLTYTYPRVYDFDLREMTEGGFYTYQPRDVTIPGLSIEVESLDEVAERVRKKSFQSAWRKSVVASVTSQEQEAGGPRREGLISVDIPLPMPSQLESIFGPGENTHINISGREEITFAGESRRVDPFIGVEGQQKQSLFPSLDMEQKLDVTLSGTIGDKVFIQVDHSSQTALDKSNNIQLWYQGYDDDIVKRVDLGNTNLSLSGSSLVGFSTASTGLFGVKILADIGATELTVIASKQEGETSGASFSPTGGGGLGTTEERVIQDINYIKNKYFLFDNWYYVNILSTRPANDDPVVPIEIWREIRPDQKQDPDVDWEPAYAFVDTLGKGIDLDTARARIQAKRPEKEWPTHLTADFERLELDVDYRFVTADDEQTILGFELIQAVQEDKALAVSYITVAGDSMGGSEWWKVPRRTGPGYEAQRDTVMLKLVKPKVSRPDNEFGFTWQYMMRNFYNLGLSNIEPASFELEIRDRTQRLDTSSPTGSAIPYIQIFGLDNYDELNNPNHDGRFDVLRKEILDTRTGVLQFPYFWAFAPPDSIVQSWTDSLFTFDDDAYRKQWERSLAMYTDYKNNPYFEFSNYDIVVRAVSTTKSFRLNALNIVENSERVTLNGRPLSRGTDYSINYDTGEVELKGNALNDLTPTSQLNIDYEYTPFGGSASSSLVGFSTQSNFSKNARLGTIFLYESKGTAMDKPRLGEEPTRAIVGGINGQLQHSSDLLTRLANVLPMVDTDAKSTLTVAGEIAASVPDPNTRGEAYIEDFEGIEDSDRITTSRRSWHPASPPVDPLDDSETLPADSSQTFLWYNIEPDKGGAHRRDFNPDLNERENTLVPTLDIEVDGVRVGPERNWVGVMTGFGAGGLDLSRGQFLEVWVNDFKPDPADRGGVLRIDMGRIDEDFFEPDKDHPDFEDQERDGWVATWDDTGLDGMFNKNEFDNPGITRLEESGIADVDSSGDDYDPSRIDGRFSKINGTERNNVDDSEDLDRSGQMEESNSYFTFTINLADSAAVDVRESFPGYDGFDRELHRNDSWRLYRVKLTDAEIVAPDGIEPRFDEIRHIRVWVDDAETVFQDSDPIGRRRLQLAEMKIVGNRWELDGVRDLGDTLITDVTNPTEFNIGVISTKTDPSRYSAPVVPREENGVYEKEQSMFLEYDSLMAGTQIRVFKQFIGQGLDLTSYRDLNFWVHADPSMFHTDLEYYFRLAFDENNFYELRFPVTKDYFDPVTGWMYGLIKLEDLTSLKIGQSESVYEVGGTIRDQVEKDRGYDARVVRRPNLFDIRFIYAGVRNVSQNGTMFEPGEIWIDDIYAGDVRRDIGLAERLSASVNIGGGVVSLGGSWQKTDADFRGLRQRRGSGVVRQSLSLNGKTRLEHFVPLFGFSIPLTGNYGRSVSTPRFLPSGDTEIEDPELRDSLRTESVTRSLSTSLTKKGSQNPLLKYTIDKMTSSFAVSEQMTYSPTARDTSRSMNGSLGYQMTWSKDRNIPLIRGTKFRYWLNSMNFAINATRRTSTSYRFRNGQFVKQPYFYDAKVRMNGSVSYSPFRSLTSSFQGTMNRDLNRPHYLWGVDIGLETARSHSMQISYKPPPIFIIGAFSPDINLSTAYTEDSGPNIRRAGDPEGTRNVTNSRTAGAKMRFDLGHYFSRLFGVFGLAGDKDKKSIGFQSTGAWRPGGAVGVAAQKQQPAPGDTTRTARGADPMIALRKLGEILTSIRKVNINVQQRFNSSYARIPDRPALNYQFGITESSGIVTSDGELSTPDRTGNTLTLNADTGVQITDDIDVSTRFATTFTEATALGATSETEMRTFPDLSVKWSGIEKFSLFKRLFQYSTANVTYKKEYRESGQKGLVTSRRESFFVTPTLTFGFKNEINSTLGISYRMDKTDNRGNIVENNNWSVALDLKKAFKGGSGFRLPIPFLSKKIKWTSALNSNLSMSYARSSGKRYEAGSELYIPIPMTSTLKISPSFTYNFSRALNGRFFIDYVRAYAQASNQTTTTLRVGISAALTF